MSDQSHDPKAFESTTRQAVVNIAQSFIKGARQTGYKTTGILALTFAAALGSVYSDKRELVFPITTAGSLASVWHVRKRVQQMRADMDTVNSLVPAQASGIVQHELRNLEKILNTGKLSFGKHDFASQKHIPKYGASLVMGVFFTPALMPFQYLMMLAGDELVRLKTANQEALEVIKQNRPAP